MAACGNGSTTPPPPPSSLPSIVIQGIGADGNYYTLEITKASAASASVRAAYAPQSGDTYVLTITLADGSTKTSKGTVTVKGNDFELKPSGSNTTFTVKTDGSGSITGITGTITVEGGGTVQPPASITPAWRLYANVWNQEDGEHQEWRSSMDLAGLTSRRPKEREETFVFCVSGISDTSMKNFLIALESDIGGYGSWKDYQWIGNSGTFDVQAGVYFEEYFYTTVWQSETIKDSSDRAFIVKIYNDEKLPSGKKHGDVMATIKDFKISFLAE
jgi:hypothetical protein